MTKTNQTTTARPELARPEGAPPPRDRTTRRAKDLRALAMWTVLRLGGAAAVASVTVAAGPARAQDFAAAGAHAAAGQDAFSAGRFELAAKEFQAAFDITKDPSLLISIGESWQRAGDGPKALAAYRSYVAVQPQATDRAEIDSRIKAIEAALGPAAPASPATSATSATSATGAGGAEQKPAPSAPAATGQAQTPAAPAATAPTPAPAAKKADAPLITPPEGPSSALKTAGWVTVASAVALATGGAIVGLGAQNRADELRRRTTILVGGQPPLYDDNQREAYTSLMTEGQAYNDASIALLSLAGAAAVIGGSLLIADYARRPRAVAPPAPGPSAPPAGGAADPKPADAKPAEGVPAAKPSASRLLDPRSAPPKVTLAPVVLRGGAGLVLLGAF
jgi:tetratricopeptide (TPR) repeat protein